jgi:5'(3')-deoxyribonucleotidase
MFEILKLLIALIFAVIILISTFKILYYVAINIISIKKEYKWMAKFLGPFIFHKKFIDINKKNIIKKLVIWILIAIVCFLLFFHLFRA